MSHSAGRSKLIFSWKCHSFFCSKVPHSIPPPTLTHRTYTHVRPYPFDVVWGTFPIEWGKKIRFISMSTLWATIFRWSQIVSGTHIECKQFYGVLPRKAAICRIIIISVIKKANEVMGEKRKQSMCCESIEHFRATGERFFYCVGVSVPPRN